jgi:hypothetical protein
MKLIQFIILISLSLFLGKVESLGFGKIDNFSTSTTITGKGLDNSATTQIQPFSSIEFPVFLIDAETESEDDNETNFDNLYSVNSFSFFPLLFDTTKFCVEFPYLQSSRVKRFILYCSLRLDC